MSDSTPQPPEQTTPSDASLAQMTPMSVSEQARMRRELRKQKMGQGADRLKKITSVQRKAAGFDADYKDEAASTTSTPISAAAYSTPQPASVVDDDDPAEVDISDHFYKPANRSRDVPNRIPPPTPPPPGEFSLNDDQLAQMMAMNPMFAGPGGGGQPRFGPGGPGMPPMDPNDPIMQMMQQMLGGGGAGGPGGMPGPGMGGGKDGLPPDLLNAFLGGEQAAVPPSPYAKWFTLLHMLCSIALGVFAVFSTSERWKGTKIERVKYEEEQKIPLFWYFSTMELLLQSTRYVLVERGGPPPGMILTTVARFLPPTIGKIIITASHYASIFSTAWQDFLVMLFTIGILGYMNSWLDNEDQVDVPWSA